MMASNNMSRPIALKFKYEDFLQDDIPNLMINIWSYSDQHGVGCTTCTRYRKMCINALKKKWEEYHIDVDIIIQRLNGTIYQKYPVQSGTYYFILFVKTICFKNSSGIKKHVYSFLFLIAGSNKTSGAWTELVGPMHDERHDLN